MDLSPSPLLHPILKRIIYIEEPLACISYVPVQILSAVTGSAGIPLYIPLLDSSSNFEIIILRT